MNEPLGELRRAMGDLSVRKFVYVAVTLPGRQVFYFTTQDSGLCWTPAIGHARIFDSDTSPAPPAALGQLGKLLPGCGIEHKWVELHDGRLH